jgi:Sec-independent protein translocase protein TatA
MSASISELLVIILVALLVIKPDQLPEVASALGRFTQTVRRMMGKVKDEMNGLIDSVEGASERKRDSK